MDVIYILTSISLVAFMILATYDGFFLHIWKYKLYKHEESLFEHKAHTIRAILFPLIIWSLLIEDSLNFFILGISLIVIDSIVLAVDAYSEKDSRSFMGGLPRWEYIIHLFANGFHYAIIVLTLSLKLTITNNTIHYVIKEEITTTFASKLLTVVAENAIPGAIILAALHLFLVFSKSQSLWNIWRSKITCC
jgi:hypothetical protein